MHLAALATPDSPSEVIVTEAPETPEEALTLITSTLAALWEGFVKNLPLIGIGLVVVVAGVVRVGVAAAGEVRVAVRDSGVEVRPPAPVRWLASGGRAFGVDGGGVPAGAVVAVAVGGRQRPGGAPAAPGLSDPLA